MHYPSTTVFTPPFYSPSHLSLSLVACNSNSFLLLFSFFKFLCKNVLKLRDWFQALPLQQNIFLWHAGCFAKNLDNSMYVQAIVRLADGWNDNHHARTNAQGARLVLTVLIMFPPTPIQTQACSSSATCDTANCRPWKKKSISCDSICKFKWIRLDLSRVEQEPPHHLAHAWMQMSNLNSKHIYWIVRTVILLRIWLLDINHPA